MLGDCHVHIIMNGKNYREAVSLHKNGVDETIIHQCFEKYRKAGISFLRDGGDCLGVSGRAKAFAGAYGIDYRTPIFAIHRKGHYGGIVGCGFEDMKEYHHLVKEVRKSGGDFIKIMLSGLIDFENFGRLTEPGVDECTIREMIYIAHEEGFAVMAHCNGARTMEAAAMAGVDSIEHGAYSDERALQVMAEENVIWTPTISPIGNLKGGGRFSDEITEQIKESHLDKIRRFTELGGNIALGSDAGAWRVPHVEGLQSELASLKKLVDESHLEKTEKIIRKRFQVV